MRLDQKNIWIIIRYIRRVSNPRGWRGGKFVHAEKEGEGAGKSQRYWCLPIWCCHVVASCILGDRHPTLHIPPPLPSPSLPSPRIPHPFQKAFRTAATTDLASIVTVLAPPPWHHAILHTFTAHTYYLSSCYVSSSVPPDVVTLVVFFSCAQKYFY